MYSKFFVEKLTWLYSIGERFLKFLVLLLFSWWVLLLIKLSEILNSEDDSRVLIKYGHGTKFWPFQFQIRKLFIKCYEGFSPKKGKLLKIHGKRKKLYLRLKILLTSLNPLILIFTIFKTLFVIKHF